MKVKGFDAIAPYYQWIEKICAGKKMQRARLAFLSDLPIPKRVLLLGEGTGSFLVKCHQKFPEASITCIDSSNAMLHEMKKKLHRQDLSGNHLTFLHQDVLSWQPKMDHYDLIVTHFFLDCFTLNEMERLIPMLSKAAKPHAHWIIADFNFPQTWFMKIMALLLVKLLYLFFSTTTGISATKLINPDFFLKKSGFLLHGRKKFCKGLLKSDCWIRAF